MKTSWETVKDFYKERFGIDGWVVELFANQDTLALCASGASNTTISNFTELPEDEIETIIKQTFHFGGWSNDLPLNPYGYYCIIMEKDGEVKRGEFTKEISNHLYNDGRFYKVNVNKIYYVCKTMYDIDTRIKDEWI